MCSIYRFSLHSIQTRYNPNNQDCFRDRWTTRTLAWHGSVISSVCGNMALIFPMTLNIGGRNVPGFAMYMTGLTQLRMLMAKSPYFARIQSSSATKTTVLPTLTTQGNLIAGATARVAVGFLLNPFSVLKA